MTNYLTLYLLLALGLIGELQIEVTRAKKVANQHNVEPEASRNSHLFPWDKIQENERLNLRL